MKNRLHTLLIAATLAFTTTVSLAQEKVEVGVITTLSGGMATIGGAVQNGIELAREKHPELFQKINFSYEDDKFDAKEVIAAYRKLTGQRDLQALFLFGTLQVQAIGGMLEKNELPTINFNFESGPVVGKDMVIRAMNHTDQYMKVLVDHLAPLPNEEFPVIKTEYSFFEAMVSSMERSMPSGTKVKVVASVLPSERDFRTTVAKLKALKSKRIGLFLLPDQLLSFYRAARELQLHATFYGTDVCETAANLAQDDSLLEGCLYPDNDVSEEFRTLYNGRFGNEAQITFAGSAYDMTVLLGTLLKDRKNTGGRELVAAFSEVKDRKGVLGTFSFQRTPEHGQFFEYPIYVKQIVGRRGVRVGR